MSLYTPNGRRREREGGGGKPELKKDVEGMRGIGTRKLTLSLGLLLHEVSRIQARWGLLLMFRLCSTIELRLILGLGALPDILRVLLLLLMLVVSRGPAIIRLLLFP
jgi:hypothetical protein